MMQKIQFQHKGAKYDRNQTDMLVMGLYDLTSAGSMLDFLRRGVMNADLKTSETEPLIRDLLNMCARKAAMRSTTPLS